MGLDRLLEETDPKKQKRTKKPYRQLTEFQRDKSQLGITTGSALERFLTNQKGSGADESTFNYSGDRVKSGMDLSGFKDNVSNSEINPYELGNIEETAAQNQSTGEKWLYGLGRLLPKIGAELGKGIGYLGGAIPALVNQDITDMTNNWMVEYFQGIEDSAKEVMPIHVRESIKNGDFWDNVGSSEFWTSEGLDGLGFLISAIGTGGAMSALSKSLQLGTKTAQMVGKGANFANKFDTALITTGQTYIEAAAETKGVIDGAKEYWKERYDPKFGYDSGKTDSEGMKIYYSEEEVKSMINSAGASTLGINSLFLALPNYIQTDMLFGKGGVANSIMSKIDTSSPKAMQESIAKMTPWKTGKSIIAKEGIKSSSAEAFQELSQFAIEDYESKKAKGLTNLGLIEGLGHGFYEGLTTVEGQKSMLLGGVLGMGPALISARKQYKTTAANTKKLAEVFNKSTAAFKEDITAIYKKNEDGSIKYDSETGKPELNTEKVDEIMSSIEEDNVLSKMFVFAKTFGNTELAKQSLTDMTVRHLYSYLGVEGGLDIWKQHVEEISKIMEADHTSLGFKSKEEYKDYLIQIGTSAQKEFSKVKDRGPAFYGINFKDLVSEDMTLEEIKEKKENFIANVEYQAIRYNILKNQNEKRISELNLELNKIKESVIPEENVSVEDVLNYKDVYVKGEYGKLNELKKSLNKTNENLDKEYLKLFDKNIQNNTFKGLIDKSRKIKEALKKDKGEEETFDKYGNSTTDKEFIQEFYKNVKDKGYTVEKGKEGQTDFGKGLVTFKNNDGEINRVYRKKTKDSSEWLVKNLETNKIQPFTLDLVKKEGFNNPDNILTRKEFQEYSKNKYILEKNKERLNSLKNVLFSHFNSKRNKKNRIKHLNDKLKEYQEEIEIWLELDPKLTVDSTIEEILRLEDLITEIRSEIETLNSNINELNKSLSALIQIRKELLEANENIKEFSIAIKMQELKEEIRNGKYEEKIALIEESVEFNKELKIELQNLLFNTQQTLDELYKYISQISGLENAIIDLNINFKLVDKLKQILPNLNLDGTILKSLNKYQYENLLKDPSTRKEILQKIKDQKQELMSLYNIEDNKAKNIKMQLEHIALQYEKYLNDKKIIDLYDKLAINYASIAHKEKIVEAKKKKNEDTRMNEEQDLDSVNEEQVRKNNQNSTSSQIFKGKRDKNGNYIVEVYPKGHAKAGQKVLNDNYRQGVRWDETLESINITDIDNYQLRFVNWKQLEELTGEKAPSNEENDIYAVLYSKETQKPVDNEGVVFTGVSKPSSMFGVKKDGSSWTSIDIERSSEFAPYVNKEISEKNPVTFNNETYNNKEDLIQAIHEDMFERYTALRENILKKINNDEEVYSAIKDISNGMPIFSNEKNKPNEILSIDKIILPDNTTIRKDNNAMVEVKPGRPYVKLKNGQYVRLYNYKIEDLKESEKIKMLDKIIGFMAAFNSIEGGKFNTEFKFGKETIPLKGNNKKAGVLDYFINWGINGESGYGIDIFTINNDANQGYEIRFKMEGVSEKINPKDLLDEKGNVKSYSDPSLQSLVYFLENKFLNINKNLLLKKNSKIPKSFNSKSKSFSYDIDNSSKGLDNYYLNNYLYTTIKKRDSEIDEIPTFVNRYVSYENKLVKKLSKPKPKPKSKPNSTNKTNNKTKSKRVDDMDLEAEWNNTPPASAYANDFVDDEMSDTMLEMAKEWEAAGKAQDAQKITMKTPKEDTTKCKTQKTISPNKKKKRKK